MDNPKFSDNSLVTYQDAICVVLRLSSKGPGYHYKLQELAYTRPMSMQEHEKTTHSPIEIEVEESLLKEFKEKAPRFKLGEGVRLHDDINCIVQFIEYRNYSYYYTVKQKVNWITPSPNGWIVEEGYLQKW